MQVRTNSALLLGRSPLPTRIPACITALRVITPRPHSPYLVTYPNLRPFLLAATSPRSYSDSPAGGDADGIEHPATTAATGPSVTAARGSEPDFPSGLDNSSLTADITSGPVTLSGNRSGSVPSAGDNSPPADSAFTGPVPSADGKSDLPADSISSTLRAMTRRRQDGRRQRHINDDIKARILDLRVNKAKLHNDILVLSAKMDSCLSMINELETPSRHTSRSVPSAVLPDGTGPSAGDESHLHISTPEFDLHISTPVTPHDTKEWMIAMKRRREDVIAMKRTPQDARVLATGNRQDELRARFTLMGRIDEWERHIRNVLGDDIDDDFKARVLADLVNDGKLHNDMLLLTAKVQSLKSRMDDLETPPPSRSFDSVASVAVKVISTVVRFLSTIFSPNKIP